MSKITEKYIFGQEDSDGNYRYDISPRNIFDFFSGSSGIKKVPHYQRPYSWTDKNVIALLNDINNLSQNDSKDKAWFLGPIYITKKSSTDKFNLILDGQQRITTLQIILREISLFKLYDDSRITENNTIDRSFQDLIEQCNQCLVFFQDGKKVPRFETESIANEIFSEYIIKSNDVQNTSELNLFRKKFSENIDYKYKQGSQTALTISNHINLVTEYLNDHFSSIDDYAKAIKSLSYFGNTILQKLWLIEIPLKEKDYSIEIFEALNNRGKGLTLVDKLQFKSLLKPILDRDVIRNYWKEIYVNLEILTSDKSKRIFSSHEEFFKIFFLVVNADEISEEDIVLKFEAKYTSSANKLKIFFEQIKTALTFFSDIQNRLDSKNEFINQYKEQYHDKLKALLQVIRRCLYLSDNTRQLIFDLITKHNPYDTKNQKEGNFIIPMGLWSITKLVFYKEIIDADGSNNIRKDFNIIIKRLRQNEYKEKGINYTNFIKRNIEIRDNLDSLEEILSLDDVKLDNNHIYLEPVHLLDSSSLLRTKSNDKAKLILYVYSYISDYHSLISGAPSQYNKEELEHVFPRAWKKSWKNKNYSLNEAETTIIDFDKSLQRVNKDIIKNKIATLDQFTLIEYTKKPIIQINSLIEWIGNKWVIHNLTNRRIKASEFIKKKNGYGDNNFIKIPKNDSIIGFDNYPNFSQKEIIERSLIIIDLISDKFFGSIWDEF